MKQFDLSLYLVTDRQLMSTDTLEQAVCQAIEGGCTLVQLREKDCSSREFYLSALRIKEVTDRMGVPLIINDRVDIALAVGAAGVHVGQNDLPAAQVKRIAPELIVGVSARTVEDAKKAQQDGADYLGVGAMFSTSTKKDAQTIGIERLKEITQTVSIPVVAIGGIKKENAHLLRDTGIQGIAVVSAVIAQSDIRGAARELMEIMGE